MLIHFSWTFGLTQYAFSSLNKYLISSYLSPTKNWSGYLYNVPSCTPRYHRILLRDVYLNLIVPSVDSCCRHWTPVSVSLLWSEYFWISTTMNMPCLAIWKCVLPFNLVSFLNVYPISVTTICTDLGNHVVS